MSSGSPVLSFLGGARTVTGSRFLLDHPDGRVLVDCGLFQGPKAERARNWEPFAVDPSTVEAVVVTHAHVDHCGYLAAFVREGFRGRILCTPATAELIGIVLPDAGRLQEEEAAYANRKGYSKHQPALPLFTEDDAMRALAHIDHVPFDAPHDLPGLRFTLRRAGHILGSSSVLLDLAGGPRVVVSGDLGRPSHPLLLPPAPLTGVDADWLLVESTYGDRQHHEVGAVERLGAAVRTTAARGGTVVIPAFAVDRTEVVLHHLRHLMDAGEIPRLRVYVDSPMALAALRVYRAALDAAASDLRPELAGSDPFDTGTLVEVHDAEGSKEIDRQHMPSIIVSASGMATGGRVLHHLIRFLPDPRNTIVLVGYQATGTRGRFLAEGARQLKLLGQYVPCRADVVDLPEMSVHADGDELVGWLGTHDSTPDGVFVVHGEVDAARTLRDRVMNELGWPAVVPRAGERVRLDPLPSARAERLARRTRRAAAATP